MTHSQFTSDSLFIPLLCTSNMQNATGPMYYHRDDEIDETDDNFAFLLC